MADTSANTPTPRGSRPAPASGAAPAPGGRGRRKGGWLRRTALGALLLALVMALVAAVGVLVFYNRTTLPDPNKDFTTNTTFLYYNDGKTKLGSFAVQNRQSLTYAEMPQNIKDAVVAAENRDFWTDRGISPSGIVRSVWTIARGGEMQGGSTITQQYIKILYLSSDRTVTRKLRELALAVKMGKQVPKEQILQGYLNTIYFGRGAYGIQAASRAYFNVDAAKLTVPQAAVLAAVINNPALYDPSVAKGNTARLLDRYRYVLDGMLQGGKITQAQHDSWAKALPAFPEIPLNQRWGGTNGYLMKMVQDELLAKGLTQSQIDGGGLTITTTFDKTLQDRAVAVGQYYKKTVGANSSKGAANLHPAIASVKVGTGEVLAIYGGDDYLKNSRNWATTDRPAASTFKAYATVAALRSGMSLYTPLKGYTFTPPGDSVPIRNENGMTYGTVSLYTALAQSINTAFVDAVTKIDNGPAAVVQAANDAGVAKGAGWDLTDRIPLGIAEVSPLDNAGGYATFANEGVSVPNHVVAKVTDASGKVIYTGTTTGRQSIEQDVARDTSYGLESVTSQQGTGWRAAQIGHEVAGKTGTNGITRDGQNIITSAWFVAYTKQVSTSVMFVAGDDGNQALDGYKRGGDSTFFGGTYPAMTWVSFMKTAMQGQDYAKLPSPAYVNANGQQYQPTEQATQSAAPVTAPTSTATAGASASASSTASATATGSAIATATATASATQLPTRQVTATRGASVAPSTRATQPVTVPSSTRS